MKNLAQQLILQHQKVMINIVDSFVFKMGKTANEIGRFQYFHVIQLHTFSTNTKKDHCWENKLITTTSNESQLIPNCSRLEQRPDG